MPAKLIQRWTLLTSCWFAMLLGLRSTAQAQSWMDSSYLYRNEVSISNPNGTPLTSFQVKINLGASFDFARAQGNAADLRVTANDGVTAIPFWIENWQPANTTATLWVQIPSIPLDGTKVWLYYGNPAAAGASNGRATFPFFDDFEVSPASPVGYFPLSAPETVFVPGAPPQIPHTMSVVQANSGGFAYAAYVGQQRCGGIAISRSADLSSWQSPTPLTSLPSDARWPSVLLVNGTYYMLYEANFCATGYIELATSTDGINFTRVKTIVPLGSYRNQNPNLYFNPNDQKFYIYWLHGLQYSQEIRARSATTVEGLSDPSSEVVLLSSPYSLAAPNMLYFNGVYFLSTEGLDENLLWATKVFSSSSPASGFQPVANTPLLKAGNACMFQHIFNNTLHVYNCYHDGQRWTVTHRTAPLIFTGVPDPSRWSAPGNSWNLIEDTQQDGTKGWVLAANLSSSQALNSTFAGTDYVVEGSGRQLSGRVWGIGVRANSVNGSFYSANLYSDLGSSNNLYTYRWSGGGVRLAAVPVGPVQLGSWYNLSIKIHSNQIDVFKDGVLQSQAFDGNLQSGGVALYGESGTQAEFNNVFVRQYSPADPVATLGSTSQGTDNRPPSGNRVNVAAAANGATVIASSSYNAGFVPGSAIDGVRKGSSWGNGGGWNDSTANAFPDWLEVDFAGPRTIHEVDVFTVQDAYGNPMEPSLGLPFTLYGLTAFQIQYWDGTSWAVIPGANITGNNQVWRQMVFAPVTTSRIRVFVSAALNSYSRITEVEAYSDVASGLTVVPGAFAKNGPANAATLQTLSPVLSWGTSSGAASYEYCLDTINNNVCDTGWTPTGTNSSSAALAGLSPATNYYWQVRSRNSNGTQDADNGAWWNFTVPAASRVNVAAAANGATVIASSSYNSQYGPTSAIDGDRKGLDWGYGGGWNDATANAFPDWLEVDFAAPQTIHEVDVFTVQDAYASPAEPSPGLSFTLYGLTAFQVQYWDASSWALIPGADITGNNQVWRQIVFTAVTTSRIRVFVTGALNSYSRITEVEAYADLASGLTLVPGAFAKSGPANAATLQTLSPVLNWGTSSGAASYEYCLDTINNNACDTSWTPTGTTSSSAALAGLSPATNYYWQVRARNSTGTTDADSGTWRTFVAGSSVINVAAAANGATVSASSSYNAQYAAAGAIDGDRKGLAWGNGGGWNDGTPDLYPDWLQINFAAAKTIAEVDVFTVQDNYPTPADPTPAMTFTLYGLTNFEVQYWNGTNWVDLPNGNVSANTLVWKKISFTAVTTTSIRVLVNGSLTTYSRITEVEAY